MLCGPQACTGRNLLRALLASKSVSLQQLHGPPLKTPQGLRHQGQKTPTAAIRCWHVTCSMNVTAHKAPMALRGSLAKKSKRMQAGRWLSYFVRVDSLSQATAQSTWRMRK
eukprot:scaffold251848_cov18-Tisochrysis_lutea.AAC.3